MKWLARLAAIEIAGTGLILLLSPVLFGQLVFSAEMPDSGQALGRLTGIALLGFALTSWPFPPAWPVVRAMLAYNCLAAVYLCYLGIMGTLVGMLLWPAVVLHVVFTALLAVALIKSKTVSSC